MRTCDNCDKELDHFVFCSPKCKAFFHNHPKPKKTGGLIRDALNAGTAVQYADAPPLPRKCRNGCSKHGKKECLICG